MNSSNERGDYTPVKAVSYFTTFLNVNCGDYTTFKFMRVYINLLK